MNDQRLLSMVRMAQEASAFETGALPAIPVVASSSTRRPSVLARLGPARIALAAAVAFAAGLVIAWPRSTAAPTPTPTNPGLAAEIPAGMEPLEYASKLFENHTPRRPAPVTPVAAVVPASQPATDESLVLAIVQDPTGGVQCISWSRELPPGAHDALAPSELAREVCQANCVDGPHWLVAAKVTGPHQAMPTGDAERHALAQCILDARSDRCDGGPTTLGAGNACLPAGLHVTVERRSMARR